MKPVQIAMATLTHGHTRQYYQTLLDNEKLDWVASCAADPRAREVYALYRTGVPCYSSMEEMFEKHPDIEAVVLASANDQHLEEMRECARRGLRVRATDVDHIVDHKGDWGKFTDRSNLESLCHPCHSRKTMREVWRNRRENGG